MRPEKFAADGLGDIGGGREVVRGEAEGVALRSREKRLARPTDKPASWRERIRSAMEPPGLRMGPSVESLAPLTSPFSLQQRSQHQMSQSNAGLYLG